VHLRRLALTNMLAYTKHNAMKKEKIMENLVFLLPLAILIFGSIYIRKQDKH
jgi:hypothetical protein